MEKVIKFSLIVPVYNVEKHIQFCLDSLYSQDIPLEEYEIIVVDDCSLDSSLAIVQRNAKEHNNIHIIEQPYNQGVSAARNAGLKAAKGEYIWFVDADDEIASNCLKMIYNDLIKSNADTYIGRYITLKMDEKILDIPDINRKYNSLPGVLHAWIHICSSNFLNKNKIYFDEKVSYMEDQLWTYYVKVHYDAKVIKSTEPIYYYRIRKDSAMHTKTINSALKHYHSMVRLAEVYQNIFLEGELAPNTKKNVKGRQHLCAQAALFDILIHFTNYSEGIKEFKKLCQKKLYPYRFGFWQFKKCKTLKQILMTSFLLFLSFPGCWQLSYKLKTGLLKK